MQARFATSAYASEVLQDLRCKTTLHLTHHNPTLRDNVHTIYKDNGQNQPEP